MSFRHALKSQATSTSIPPNLNSRSFRFATFYALKCISLHIQLTGHSECKNIR